MRKVTGIKEKLIVLIALLMAFSFALIQPMVSFAEEVTEEEIIEEEKEYPAALEDASKYKKVDPEASQSEEIEAFEEYDEIQLFFNLEQRIKSALLSGEPGIDIQDMAIDSNRYRIYMLPYFSPYLCNGIDAEFRYAPSLNVYTYIELTNSMNREETEAHFMRMDGLVCEILSQVSDGMSEEEKALVIHDYFASQYEYDEKNFKAQNIPKDSYRAGGLFMNGTGVCQAYAGGYQYIMNKLGIECYLTGSNDMNHAWNIIRIDGAYYHVDCTWDDPMSDNLGRVNHNFFLLSDGMVRQQNHRGWDRPELVCSSTRYAAVPGMIMHIGRRLLHQLSLAEKMYSM